MQFFIDRQLWYVRKPAGLASSYGREVSLLDLLERGEVVDTTLPVWVEQVLEQRGIVPVASKRPELLELHEREEERGLLNRLDTATSGLLYFAPSRELYSSYRDWQAEGRISKYYLARVEGDVRWMRKETKQRDFVEVTTQRLMLTYPIMHHQHLSEQMITAVEHAQLSSLAETKGRGKRQMARSEVSIVKYDPADDQTLVAVTIQKGVRHQIRVHLSAL